MSAVIAPATPLPTKLEWADCSCGHKSCKRAYPINFGTFYQGTGFEPHERAALDSAWNTRAANCHPELVEAMEGLLDLLVEDGWSWPRQIATARAALAKARGR